LRSSTDSGGVGLSSDMCDRIEDLLSNTKAVLGSARDKITLDINQGVRQGCPLGPILFLVVLAYFLNSLKNNKDICPELDFEFADDLTLIDSSKEKLGKCLKYIEEEGLKFGLIINNSKTEFLSVDNGSFISGGFLLGHYMGDDKKAVNLRISKASKSFWCLYHKVFNRKEISSLVKIRLFNSICISSLLYGLENICITKELSRLLDSFAFRCVKRILNIKYTTHGHASRDSVYELLHNIKIKYQLPSATLRIKRLDNYFHFLRNHRNDPRDLFNYNALKKNNDFRCFKYNKHGKRLLTNGNKLLYQVINKDLAFLKSIGEPYIIKKT
jgi:hypothetical protein